jgi:ABC-type bacteriocin/lantibiotic exporter with double-glycine peptidase domain
MFVQILPQFMAAVGSFVRVQQFLLSDIREDSREREGSPTSAIREEASSSQRSVIELTAHPAYLDNAISITNGAFGWSDNSDAILKDVNIEIKKGDLAMVVGPVGSGKSSLLKAMLEETKRSRGQVYIGSQKVSFCDQTPWLMNGSIRGNIIGMTDFDSRWYDTVIDACALRKDIDDMPVGDQTLIGSRVLALSGGQKQRIASHDIPVISGSSTDVFSQLRGQSTRGITLLFSTTF